MESEAAGRREPSVALEVEPEGAGRREPSVALEVESEAAGQREPSVALEVEPEAAGRREPSVATRRTARRWRWAAAALAVSLCVAAAGLLAWRMRDPDQSLGGSDLLLKLRKRSLAGDNTTAAIHLRGKRSDQGTSVLWDSTFPSKGEDLKLEHHAIVVQRSGLYFVYSQASFQVTCPTVHTTTHRVRRQQAGGEHKILMSGVHTVCMGGAHGHKSDSIYLGGVFKLKRGDMLSTYTGKEGLSSLEQDETKTFFGAFAV